MESMLSGENLIIAILTVSVLCQLSAAILALKLIPLTGNRRAWILISLGIFLMTVRRTISLFRIVLINGSISSDLSAEWTALATSVLLLLGISRLGPFFQTIRRSTEAIRASEERYRRLFEDSKDAIYETAREGEIVDANHSFLELFGYTRPETESMNIRQIYTDPAERTIFQKEIERLGFVKDYETRYRKKDGTNLTCLLTSTLRVHKGQILGYRGIIRDITLQKQTEKALRDSEAKFRAVTEATASGIFIIQGNRFRYVNPSAEAISGYPKEALLNKTYKNILHIDFKDTIRKLRENIRLQQDFCLRDEIKIITRQGGEKWLDLILTTIRFENRPALLATAFDITQSKKTRQALRESEERYRLFFEEDLTGDYIADAKGRFMACNPALARILGFSSVGEVVGHHIYEFLPDRQQRSEIYRLIREEKKLEYCEVRLRDRHQHTVHAIQNIIGKFDSTGALIQFKGYLFDITEYKKLEERLRQSQKMEAIGTLAGGIAHDFNNILAPIIGYADLAILNAPDSGKVRRYMTHITIAARRARDLVHQILTFSRQTEHRKEILKVQPVIKEALKLLRATLPTTIELIANIAPDCGTVRADPVQIHQIVMNLCTNAYHAMQERGGKLEVALDEIYMDANMINSHLNMSERSYLRITISDTGQGMAPATLDRIFDPYFTTKEKGRGTGLGLSVVHGIIRSYEGDIRVYSEPDQGTTFHVYLPIVHSDIAETDNPEADPVRGGNERILLVDDEEPIVEMTTEILTELGYEVTAFTDSTEALTAIRNHPDRFDLVITDQTMPKMTGLRLAAHLMKIGTDIPVILCSGFSEMVTADNIREMGVFEYLMKPVAVHDLSRTIRQAIESPAPQSLLRSSSEITAPEKPREPRKR